MAQFGVFKPDLDIRQSGKSDSVCGFRRRLKTAVVAFVRGVAPRDSFRPEIERYAGAAPEILTFLSPELSY